MNYVKALFLSISVFIFVIAETAKSQSLELGITGGVNLSSHLSNFQYSSGDINLELNPKVTSSYHAGLVVRKKLSRSFRLQIEPSYIQLGAKYNEPFQLRGFELQTDSQTELQYIYMPLLLQLTSQSPYPVAYGRQQAATTYHATGGLFGSYLLDARFKGTTSGAPIGIPFEGQFSNNVSGQYPEYNGGVVLGVGLEHGLDQKIGLEARALLSVFNGGDDSTLMHHSQNTALTFSVYFLL